MHHQPLSANNTVLNLVTSKGENIITVLTYLVQTMNHIEIFTIIVFKRKQFYITTTTKVNKVLISII